MHLKFVILKKLTTLFLFFNARDICEKTILLLFFIKMCWNCKRLKFYFKAQDKLKTFKGVFLKESASTRTMILSMKNKYIVRSRISQKKFREILKYFAQDIEATKIANLTGISRISINKILKNIRILMASECEKISKFSGEISKPA